MAKKYIFVFYTRMNIAGIQNCISTYYPNFRSGKDKVITNTLKQNYISEYNPAYYMPSFQGLKEKKFNKLFKKGLEEELSEKELNKLACYIYDIKDKAVKDQKRYIGSGTFGNVYKIDDEYVLKVKKYYYDRPNRKFIYKKNDDISIPGYYGGLLAVCDSLSVLKNADPNGDAIISGPPFWLSRAERYDYMVNKSLPAFANLPQASYDKYAMTLKLMNKSPYPKSPDTVNTNNFMIVGDEIRFVDGLNSLLINHENNLYTVCSPFLNQTMTLDNGNENIKTLNNKHEILKKCVLAAEEADLPLPKNHYEKEKMGKILNVCGYENNEIKFLAGISSIRKSEPNKTCRKQKIAEYMDNLK